jgi:hypothetical protein
MAERPGLPPVAPPSGRFIAQLFLVPGLIVFVLVLIWLAGHYLVAEKRSPDYFLRNLDSSNEDIRWRAASDLAQVLNRPESIDLASDSKFALELTERLEVALRDLEKQEQELAKESGKMSEQERLKAARRLKPQRKYVLFLISALGGFTAPVSAPLLCKIATREPDTGDREAILRRRQAVWALANLGDKLKRFKQELSEEKRQKVIATLKDAQASPGPRGEYARAAYLYLTENKLFGVDTALEKCADADDPFLRELVATALNFWDGPRVLPTLEKLANDDGHGTPITITEDDE